MSLFLIRHAHAVDATENPKRPLSSRGHKQIRKVAAFLKKTDALDCAEIWHSPLARSRETAALFAQKLPLAAKLVQSDGLEGADDPALLAERLKGRSAPLAIVGHEPHLSALASLLVAGVATPPRFVFKKCAVVALDGVEGAWAVRWQISPSLLG